MSTVRKVGHDPETNRELFLLTVPNAAAIPDFELDSSAFVVFLAWDSSNASEIDLLNLGKKLISLGGVSFCCWGPGCELLHDAIDHADLELNPDRPDDEVIMTTWHNKEPLSEALWFFLNSAFPHNAYEPQCQASITIVVGNQSWATECADALANPRAFSEAALSE